MSEANLNHCGSFLEVEIVFINHQRKDANLKTHKSTIISKVLHDHILLFSQRLSHTAPFPYSSHTIIPLVNDPLYTGSLYHLYGDVRKGCTVGITQDNLSHVINKYTHNAQDVKALSLSLSLSLSRCCPQ